MKGAMGGFLVKEVPDVDRVGRDEGEEGGSGLVLDQQGSGEGRKRLILPPSGPSGVEGIQVFRRKRRREAIFIFGRRIS